MPEMSLVREKNSSRGSLLAGVKCLIRSVSDPPTIRFFSRHSRISSARWRSKMSFGVFGKLPQKRDFVALNIPRAVLEPFETWLQSAVAASRNELKDDWR